MADTIVRFKSKDGKEFPRKEDAEEHDLYLQCLGLIYRETGPGYSDSYDGPMPVSRTPPSAEYFFRHRKLLRNMFLDLPEPEPREVVKWQLETTYRYPVTLMIISALLGLWAGWGLL